MLSTSLRRASTATLTAPSLLSPAISSFNPDDFTLLISHLPPSLRRKTLISLPYLIKTSLPSLPPLWMLDKAVPSSLEKADWSDASKCGVEMSKLATADFPIQSNL